jgi:hypothetical protein
MTGRLKSPTTHLPIKKGGAGKIVVMLSSVAKPASAGTQLLRPVPPLADAPPKDTPVDPSQAVSHPLPPKQVSPGNSPQPQPRLSTTTHVKLPPKTQVPMWSSLSGKPIAPTGAKEAPESKATPPPLPVKWSEPKKSGAQHIPPIKLNAPSSGETPSGESIFPETKQPEPGVKPQGWKSLEPGELNSPTGNLQSLDVFERSQRLLGKPTPEAPLLEAKDKAVPLVAPPLRPPARVESPASVAETMPPVLPPPLPPPLEKPAESSAPHVAPPLLEKEPESRPEKLPPPNFPADARKGEPDSSESPGVHKVPALIQPDAPSIGQPPQALPPKALLPPTPPSATGTSSWFKKASSLKKSTPLVVSSSSPKAQIPTIAEAKPALKPAVLPKRSLLSPKQVEGEAAEPSVEAPKATEAAEMAAKAEKSDATAPAAPAAQLPETGMLPFGDKEELAAKVLPAQPPPNVPVSPTAKKPLPLTRAERLKKRRFWEVVVFYVLLVITAGVLFLASLHFGRDTRVEGQVIPPPGTTLNNEVWIVTDFSPLVSGIVEDLAQKRASALQEIQFPQDHVQRALADVAAREGRIRLIQENIQASKDEIASVVQQSRDATQQIWDGEGAQIDEEYESHFNQLKQAIADRAKSLNLNYEPDPTYPSPEVWANAYRLALYEVPAGVDSVKEHQWLGDQMKQWRDFEKSLDDRKEQLREQAAQIKLAPASKITDLNTKIEDLQQRIDSTAAEEVPLKAELQQAQTDLAAAQATEAGLDDEYYKQLDSLPEESITKRIPLATNGRFTWVDDDVFAEGENEHHYWLFVRATRADGRQYWALHPFSIGINQTLELYIEPTGFISTKAILRPELSPDEQEQ